jgi:hypothetical protein
MMGKNGSKKVFQALFWSEKASKPSFSVKTTVFTFQKWLQANGYMS